MEHKKVLCIIHELILDILKFFYFLSGREQLLNEEDLLIIQTQLPVAVAVCGMAYAMQSQICSTIFNGDGRNAYSFAFYDSFSLWSNTSTAAIYFTNPTPESVQNVMVSAEDQLTSLTTPPDEVSAVCSVSLTGNPSLQSWDEVNSREFMKRTTRKILYGNKNDNVVGIIYAGRMRRCNLSEP